MLTFTLPYDVAPSHEPDYPARTDVGPEPSLSGAAVLLVASDGACSAVDGHVRVEGATWVEAVLSTATTSRWPEPGPLRDPSEAQADALARARVALPVSADVGDAAQARHVTDHRSLADATRLDLAGPVELALPGAIDDAPRPELAQAAFAYGRYLLMAASRPGAPPATLQGVWNDQHRPPWSSAYTLNINLQMTYWAAESAGLSVCHDPLFDHLRVLAREGEAVAGRLYGVRGWVAHHNSDVWGWALPVGGGHGDPAWASWWMGGVWLCRHLWDHYEYTLDVDFLRFTAWPLLRGAASFCVDWLVATGGDADDAEGGPLVPSPSSSPENVRIRDGRPVALCAGSTIDVALVRDLLTHVIEAAELVGSGDPEVAEWLTALARLPGTSVGADGLVREWPDDAPSVDAHHRHLSHLVDVYPLDRIRPDTTPELAAAAARSLDARGPGSTGWSMAWKAALRARLGDGPAVGALIDGALVRASASPGQPWAGGLLPNMFSTHPPFQLDGNLGLVAAVAESLLGSTRSRLVLLPALPPSWTDGSATGLRARGALTVDVRWEAGRLVEVVLHPAVDGEREVVYAGVSRRLVLVAGTAVRLVPDDRELVARA
jgi:alpha-L-fucosidase 2